MQYCGPPNFTMKFQCAVSTTDVTNYVKSLGSVNPANLLVTTTWPGTTATCSSGCSACSTTNSPGCMVKVQVNYTFTFLAPFWKQSSVNFYGTAEKTIQQ